MKQTIYILSFVLFASCGQSKQENKLASDTIPTKNNKDSHNLTVEQKQNPEDFVPKEYVLLEKITGDLNKDGIDDCVLIIKGTDTSQIITDEYSGRLDRNRRGIIVLFKKNDYYESVVKNYECFSSENEDGGVYFPPELSVEIEKGNLCMHYGHGRYGYWRYTFRYQHADFELIGYDQSDNRGPIVNRVVSMNFVSKKKQEKVNTNDNTEEEGEEIFKETWKNINVDKLIRLSEIESFDDLNMTEY